MNADPLGRIREQLTHGVGRERGRVVRRRVVVSALAAVLLLAGTAIAVASPWRGSSNDEVVAQAPETSAGGRSERSWDSSESAPIWSIEQPWGWKRAGRELMSNLGWDSLTMATITPRPGGERCAHVPEHTLRDLGPDDALLSIFFTGSAAPEVEPWPADFGPEDLELMQNGDPQECADRTDLEIHWGQRARSGQAFYVLVAFGMDAADEVKGKTWETLGSFQPLDPSADASTPECVVTLPSRSQPSSSAGVPSEVATPGQGWVGSAELWTELPYSGIHERRKSTWWSDEFPGGSVEENPPIEITWRPLNVEDPKEIVAPVPGTNARTADSGWLMINGIDPPAPGCWEVTAEYKGAEMSYTYRNPGP